MLKHAPHDVHQHRAVTAFVPRRRSAGWRDEAGDVEDKQNQERLRDPGIEESALDHTAFGSDIELAQPGIDKRHHGGQQNVGREHGLVNLVPERIAVIALDAGIGDVGKHEVRQCVGQNGGPEAGNVGVTQEQIDQRRGKKNEARQRIEEVAHGVEVAEPLRQTEAGREERIISAQNLNHAACPANALAHVRGEALGRESGSLGNVDVGSVPAYASACAARCARLR